MSLIPDAAVAVDSSARIVSVNDQAEAMFGYAAGSLVGVPVETLVPERVRRRHRQHWLEFMASPQARPMGSGLEVTGCRLDGITLPLDISLAPVVCAGEQLVVAAIRDMTAQRQAAAQAERATIVRGYADEQAALRRVATLVAREVRDQTLARVRDHGGGNGDC
jgi:PAS domain S-box-containing protein